MAVGIPFPEANAILRAPTAEDDAAGTVYALHVYRYKDLDGNPQVMSKWQFSPEEIEEIVQTGTAWFNCWGVTHPPMWISGNDPFKRKS